MKFKYRYLVIKENEPNYIFRSNIKIEDKWKHFYIPLTEEQYQYLKSIGTDYDKSKEKG